MTDLFDDGDLSDPPKDVDENLESEVSLNNIKLQDKQTIKVAAKLNNDLDDDTFIFEDANDESDYEEGCKNKSKKKSPNTGRKAKSALVKENCDVKKGKGKKQTVSEREMPVPLTKTASPSQTKKVSGLKVTSLLIT